MKNLGMNEDDIKWMKNLTRIATGDYEAFDYVGSQLGLSAVKLAYYKGACSMNKQ
jgi:hypothetical protein